MEGLISFAQIIILRYPELLFGQAALTIRSERKRKNQCHYTKIIWCHISSNTAVMHLLLACDKQASSWESSSRLRTTNAFSRHFLARFSHLKAIKSPISNYKTCQSQPIRGISIKEQTSNRPLSVNRRIREMAFFLYCVEEI